MRGFITEKDFDLAEREFPGICQLYQSCENKPRTFLDLVTLYLRMVACAAAAVAA